MTTTLTDRELDAWLAERLFGLPLHEWRKTGSISGFQNFYECTVDPPHGMKCRASNFDLGTRYSSTGDGMLLVLEAMRERGWWGTTNTPDSGMRDSGMSVSASFWRLHLHDSTGPHGEPSRIANDLISREAATLPRAVAEAAYAALSEAS
ncbi:MAG: hypothetical protein KGL39_35210 [Patescibacteria group bacterium]|nr:hypothetical protein [Patescibacteria group bacterium]